ncbi:CHASE domain-containing protein [Calothrix sp. UHCC 0171]|uniref:CHASE domain-containing protein n=1 Tax=Calothrix sp. UHCC 0171 TaxID=3110245 RepID=UPI002B1FC3D2|nr:CHASE domain-containing protein [Calothrix sp. UHCC 0171]MEA5570888.1 CHASE domain-containing protein [Calothrix sp. UHCC 0171]
MNNRGDKLYKNLLLSLNPTQTKRGWLPYVILLGTLLLTSLFSYYGAIASRTKDRLRFNNEVEQTQSDIQNRLHTYVTLLHGASGLFATNHQITREDFQAYVQHLELRKSYPGVQGIGFSMRVKPEDVQSLVNEMQKQGFPNFALHPNTPRNEYHTIIYLEPLDQRNQTAIGYDMFSEATRRAAMERARDSGLPAASGRVTLLQEIEQHKQAGFLIYVPIYRQNQKIETVAERRDALLGFVYSPFRADDLFAGILQHQQNPLINVDIYDDQKISPENLLHSSFANNYWNNYWHTSPETATFKTTKNLNVAGKTWTIVFSSRHELETDLTSRYVPYMQLAGVTLSLILFAMARSQVNAFNATQKSNRQLSFLYEMSSNLLVQAQPKEFISSIFNQLSEQLQLEIYFNYLLENTRENNHQRLRLHAYAGISEDSAKKIEWLEVGEALCGTVAQQKKQIIVERIQESTDNKADLVKNLGVTAYACYPLLSGQQLIGTLTFCTRSRTCFQSDELALLQIVADLVATALERDRLMRQLQEHTEELQQANRIKDEFLATLSHELRTPLNAILGWVQLLQTRKLDDTKIARALETIDRNSRLLGQLVEDILDVSRIISGKFRLNVEEVNVKSVVMSAIDTIQPAVDAKQIQITTQLQPDALIWGDANRLQQVIWNLISNAIKFTPKDGQVKISLEKISSQIQIQIADTGQGIKPEFLPYVFDRFRQADGSSTRSFGGLGLGLAIVRHIVELHGGTVSATSPGEGKGATFTVELPVLATRQKIFNSTPQAIITHEVSTKSQRILDGLKIILVEDENDARELIATVLEEAGAEVILAANVAQALHTLQQSKPDILISDIGMPQEDGYMLIRKVRALSSEQGGKTPALALTAFAGEEDKNQALNAGFQGHLAKPVEPIELVTRIADLVKSMH